MGDELASNERGVGVSPRAHVNQGTAQEVFQSWLSFFAQVKDYAKNLAKYTGRPKIPKYKRTHQKDAILTNQVCTIKNQKWLKFPKTKHQLNIGKIGEVAGKLKQVRIIPRYHHYTVEVVLEIDSSSQGKTHLDPQHYMGIDVGINNLATMVTNTGRRPVLVKGKKGKSINQYYNKQSLSFF